MACVPVDEHHPHYDKHIISFNTIGNNSISHHVPIPGMCPPSTPRRTPRRTPLRKRVQAVQEEPAASVPTIDGYSIHPDDESVKIGAAGISFMGCLADICNWYAAQLETNPVRSKSLTAGALAVVGDVLAQIIEFGSDVRDSDIMFDRRRIFAMFIEGSCVSGPMLHFVFEFYEYVIPIHCVDECMHKENESLMNNDLSLPDDELDTKNELEYAVSKRQYLAALLHVAFDQVIMAFPYVGGMMICTALVEGHGDDLAEELEEEYMNNVKASWVAALGLAPIQFLSFRYLPATLRVLAVNLQDIVWVMVMSYGASFVTLLSLATYWIHHLASYEYTLVTHRTRETSEPFFDFNDDDFADHDDLFSVHYNATRGSGGY